MCVCLGSQCCWPCALRNELPAPQWQIVCQDLMTMTLPIVCQGLLTMTSPQHPSHPQAASHVDTVVFDKTGTLTAGRPAVVDVRPLPAGKAASKAAAGKHHGQELHAEDPAELLRLAAAVERGSTHPLARAIAAAVAAPSGGGRTENGNAGGASSSGAPHQYTAEEGSFVQEPGSGVTATVAGRRVSVGTLEWVTRPWQAQQAQQQGEQAGEQQPAEQQGSALISLDEQERRLAAAAVGSGSDGSTSSSSSSGSTTAELAAAEQAVAASRPGHILVYVGIDGRAAGTIEIADELRPDAAATVQQLQVRCAGLWAPAACGGMLSSHTGLLEWQVRGSLAYRSISADS